MAMLVRPTNSAWNSSLKRMIGLPGQPEPYTERKQQGCPVGDNNTAVQVGDWNPPCCAHPSPVPSSRHCVCLRKGAFFFHDMLPAQQVTFSWAVLCRVGAWTGGTFWVGLPLWCCFLSQATYLWHLTQKRYKQNPSLVYSLSIQNHFRQIYIHITQLPSKPNA